MRRLSKKNYTLPLIALLIVAVVSVALIVGGSDKSKTDTSKSGANTSACGPYRNDRRVVVNGQVINAELAASARARETGLSGRPCILPDQAMLFAFRAPSRYQFWMKDMKFPIDIVWINSAHKVVAIEINFKPSSYPEVRANALPAQFVLELRANRSKELHMDLGTTVSF